MGELSIHRWKGFELYPVINKKTVSVPSNAIFGVQGMTDNRPCCALGQLRDAISQTFDSRAVGMPYHSW
jgi:hypothetical protein